MPELDIALLDLVRRTGWIADMLREFDFDVDRVTNGPLVHLADREPLETIATDAAQGAFMLVGSTSPRPVLYVGSEFAGGLIATSLRDALALVVGLPSLHDATAREFGDDGGMALRAWLAECDAEAREDWPNLDADRSRLREALGLPSADGLLEALHTAAADERFRPISVDGTRYNSMLEPGGSSATA
jgi:hypothetical protein